MTDNKFTESISAGFSQSNVSFFEFSSYILAEF